MSQMSQLSQMSHVFQIPIRQWGPQLLLLLPQTDPLQSSHHNFLSFGPIPTNFIPMESSAHGDPYDAPKIPQTASCEGSFELQSLCVGKIIFWADKMANHEPPSSSAMQDGSCCSTRPHLLPRAATLSTAMQNGSHSSTTSHFSAKMRT